MNAFREYGRGYFFIVFCFAVTALFAAIAVDNYVPAAKEGSTAAIMIDPGHGGEDGGAISVTGVQESMVNLQISERLRDLLHFCGQSVTMTRDGDYAVYDDGCSTIAQKKSSDLRNRAAMLQDNPGAILISIHQNQFSDEQYYGAQVFYRNSTESYDFAQTMQETLCAGLDPNNHRQIKPAEGVYLLEHIDNTAILIECGFLSNRKEEAMLREEGYQKKIVCCIGAGLMTYLNAKATV